MKRGAMVFALLAVASHAMAQKEAENLFRSNETVAVEITAPWRELQRDESERAWPATITWTDEAGQMQTLGLTVERRGISRQRVCDFPPIRLRFEKRVTDEGLFDHQKSLKLVTHCKDSDRWQQYYILEMLAYRIFNLMTDISFRVRPLEITYTDSDRGKSLDPKFGFVIEDDKAVARRLGLKKLDVESTRPGRLEPLEASRLALFQMMIGNLDWSPLTGPDGKCCHNGKLIGRDPQDVPVFAIPYDFDSTGLVNPPYAVPPAALPVRSIRTRMYRGYCAHNATLEAARAQILDLRPQITGL
ncbi:MAG: hypothetical protein R3212_12300, partial [Xanthomonadales bacterium]|nr:hypothetical protein [Xanthomonadales bacterium]